MAEAYKKLFDKPIYTVYTGYSAAGVSCDNKTKSVVYLGNLGFNRYEPLTEIGRALKGRRIYSRRVFCGEQAQGVKTPEPKKRHYFSRRGRC